ncbi:hypothetical protein BaRGS_00005249 [Batillaria attramentaria]|uniref:Uncharacterized protein n=1 Tax=Batillaria attramentaria TaxID=370345 RepID=A0ABD0LW23_9CAEN
MQSPAPLVLTETIPDFYIPRAVKKTVPFMTQATGPCTPSQQCQERFSRSADLLTVMGRQAYRALWSSSVLEASVVYQRRGSAGHHPRVELGLKEQPVTVPWRGRG